MWLAGPAPWVKTSASSTRIPPTFAAMSVLLVRLPARTPAMFTSVSVISAAAATALTPAGPSGTNERST